MLRYRTLSLIRSDGPISRAEIARRLAVSKPSVSSVVRDLLERGLIAEAGQAHASIGRRAIALALAADAATVIGIDVGATSIRAASCDAAGRTLALMREPTQGHSEDTLIDQLAGICAELRGRVPASRAPVAVAIGTPGVIDPESGGLRYAPNLPALERPGLADRIERALGLPVTLHNDVNLAALGEHWRGAGRHLRNFAFIGIGTGLGFGFVLNGELFTGTWGRAGEFSLTRVHPGRDRLVEDVVAGAGLARNHRALGGSGRPEDAFAEHAAGIEPGTAVLEEFLECLASVIAALTTILDPERIVLGGGIGMRLGPQLPELRRRLARAAPFTSEVVLSEQGDHAGLHGALWSALWHYERRLLRELDTRDHAGAEALAVASFRESMMRLGDAWSAAGEADAAGQPPLSEALLPARAVAL